MLKRYSASHLMIRQLIVISIMLLALIACAAPHSAQVSDRSQPPSRKIVNPKTHQVMRGETLFSIAWRYGVDYRQLARHNKIPPPYTIYPRQTLRLDVNLPPASSSTTRQSPSTTPSSPPRYRPPSQGIPVETPPALVSTPETNRARSEIKTPAPRPASPAPLLVGDPKWQWPATGILLSSYQGNNGLNKGIDISGKLGQPVLAAASGQVVYAGSGLRGYGKLLIIKHNETFLSAYAHNDNLLLKEGDIVKAGQKIADMGSSGTDRVKLHFEIRRDGVPVDPMRYLPKR